VSGSDEKDSSVLAALSALGATVYSSHESAQVEGADLVIYSNAISKNNSERIHAAELEIPIYTRAQALALLMSKSISIAVAGTHGKTTTSSMLTVALQACGVDPSFAIGGTISASGSNAHRGTGEYFVAEADESDGSFIEYKPFGAIVTNIEHDHVDFFATPADVTAAFDDFAATISLDGFLVYCADDSGSQSLGNRVKNIASISYGEDSESDLHIDQVELSAKSSRARALWNGKSIGHLELNVPGRHNIDNAAAALAVGLHLGLPAGGLLAGLASFAGTGRRFELKGTVHGIRVIDDFGHHPTEIRVTLDAARRYAGDGRLLVIFQPHRYSRTQAFMTEFASSLSLADTVILLEIYAASEKPIAGISSEVIAQSMHNGIYIPNFVEATDAITEMAKPGDVIMTLGAGDVSSLGLIIIDGLTKRFANN
jgi:UDP-N-acetylmuramate--alanine ligase